VAAPPLPECTVQEPKGSRPSNASAILRQRLPLSSFIHTDHVLLEQLEANALKKYYQLTLLLCGMKRNDKIVEHPAG